MSRPRASWGCDPPSILRHGRDARDLRARARGAEHGEAGFKLLDSDMHIVDPRPACARTVTRDTTVADHDGTDGRIDPRRGRPSVKTLRNALIIIVLGLIVPAPVHAKDQWVVAFRGEPLSLHPA